MPRPTKSRSQKAGLPPGSLVHIGEKLSETTKVTLLDYDGDHYLEKNIDHIEELRAFMDRQTVSWVHIEGIHDTRVLEQLGDVFGLHPLILEDILNTDQRPKMQDMGDYIFIVLKRFCNTCDEHSDITAEQVSVILGPKYVISFQERKEALLDPIRERIKTSKGRIRKTGADYLAYAIIDMILDSYFGILETLGEKIEIEEEALVNNPAQSTLRAIQHLKRDMIFLRKSIWPLRESISALERSESPLIQDATGIYLKDIYDHAIQIIDTVETYREMLSGMIDIYLSSLSNRMNQVMKVLTIIATIFIPLTFLAGVYGMNFKHFPELEWHWGYLLFWIISMTIAVVMLILFKRKKWL
ncbi:MAG: magnesium/cobalt transporter CorA [Syntrophales bacterium]|nr:magnesium/cobalt transporter CorA [Syntrophales bacterium]